VSKNPKSGKFMENAKNLRPLDPESTDASLNSEIHATTAINSSVSPESYPQADRDEQVRAATGRPPKAVKGGQ
jgi:hypothetical protein